ncbi:acyl-CoA thioesterase II [Microbacterium mitrae]
MTNNNLSTSDPVAAMVEALDITDMSARTTEDIFTGKTLPMPHGRIYGGQVLAQAIVAASRTLPETRHVHSMHGYFLRPGDATTTVTLSVDRIHDGRSFSTRRVQAFQEGVPIFSMISSFQDDDKGVEHQDAMPAGIPDPEDLPNSVDVLAEQMGPGWSDFFMATPLEQRYVTSPIQVAVTGERTATNAVWVKTRKRLPDDPWLHRAGLAFLSDTSIQDSVLRAHGVPWITKGLKIASLDHAMWWHRDARVDEWLLYVQNSPNAINSRGLAQGRIYSRDGALVASVAQEIMIRVPADTPGITWK